MAPPPRRHAEPSLCHIMGSLWIWGFLLLIGRVAFGSGWILPPVLPQTSATTSHQCLENRRISTSAYREVAAGYCYSGIRTTYWSMTKSHQHSANQKQPQHHHPPSSWRRDSGSSKRTQGARGPLTDEGRLLQQLEGLRRGRRRAAFRSFLRGIDDSKVIDNGR